MKSSTHAAEAIYDAWADKLTQTACRDIRSAINAVAQGEPQFVVPFLTNALDAIGERAS